MTSSLFDTTIGVAEAGCVVVTASKYRIIGVRHGPGGGRQLDRRLRAGRGGWQGRCRAAVDGSLVFLLLTLHK